MKQDIDKKTQDNESLDIGFLQLRREIRDDYFDGLLTFDEMFLFIWLQWNANPVNGIFHTSYTSLESQLNGKYRKDKINRIMIFLKKKKYIWFPDHKGRRGMVGVVTRDYPLSNGRKLDVDRYFEPNSDRGDEGGMDEVIAEVRTEVDEGIESFNVEDMPVIKGKSLPFDVEPDRGPNNDNKNDKYKKTDTDKIDSMKVGNAMSPMEFIPKTEEEEVCKNIAHNLDEPDMQFILSILKKHGLQLVKEAWVDYQAVDTNSIGKPGAYFNKLVMKRVAKLN